MMGRGLSSLPNRGRFEHSLYLFTFNAYIILYKFKAIKNDFYRDPRPALATSQLPRKLLQFLELLQCARCNVAIS